MTVALRHAMRALVVAVVFLVSGCEGEPEAEEVGEDVEVGCFEDVGDFGHLEEEPLFEADAGLMVMELLEPPSLAPSVDLEPVPFGRADVVLSPLPWCLPRPACLEALMRDKPISGPDGTHVWFFDGRRVEPGPLTKDNRHAIDAIAIVDLTHDTLIEPAVDATTQVHLDGPRVAICIAAASPTGLECQVLDLVRGEVVLQTRGEVELTSLRQGVATVANRREPQRPPRSLELTGSTATTPAPAGGTASSVP